MGIIGLVGLGRPAESPDFPRWVAPPVLRGGGAEMPIMPHRYVPRGYITTREAIERLITLRLADLAADARGPERVRLVRIYAATDTLAALAESDLASKLLTDYGHEAPIDKGIWRSNRGLEYVQSGRARMQLYGQYDGTTEGAALIKIADFEAWVRPKAASAEPTLVQNETDGTVARDEPPLHHEVVAGPVTADEEDTSAGHDTGSGAGQAEVASDSAQPRPTTDDSELARARKHARKPRPPTPREQLIDVLIKIHRSGTDIRRIHRGRLQALALEKAGIKGGHFGASEKTFERALAAAMEQVKAGEGAAAAASL